MRNKQNMEFFISRFEKNDIQHIPLNMVARVLREVMEHMEEQDRRISSDIEQIARLQDKVLRYEEGMKHYQNM